MKKRNLFQRKKTYERFQGERYEDLAMKLSEWIADEHVKIRLEKDAKVFKDFLEGERNIVYSASYMKLLDIIECPQMYQKFYGVSFFNPGDPELIRITPRTGFYRSLADGKSNFSIFKKVRFDKNVEYWLDLKNMALLKYSSKVKWF